MLNAQESFGAKMDAGLCVCRGRQVAVPEVGNAARRKNRRQRNLAGRGQERGRARR